MVTVLLVVVALAPLVTIGLSLFGAAVDLVHELQKTGGARDALQALLKTEPTLPKGGVDPQQAVDFAQRHGGGALNAATMIFGAATSAAIGLFVFVYGFYTCLVDGRRCYEWLLDHSPLERSQTARYAAAYSETGRGLLLGVGGTALLQGAIATVGYVIIGVPQGLVLGLVTVLAALIPSIGTGLVWVPVTAGLFLAGRTTEAVAVLALGVVMSVADNFARPVLSRYGHLDLHTFVVFCAMLGGIGVFGAWGLLAGPLFARMTVEALRLGRERRELGEPVELFKSSTAPSQAQQVLATPGE
jgi:predicted PurR-regulated permease PerM